MKIIFMQTGLNLSEDDQDYVTKKIEHLGKFAERINDESTEVTVNIRENKLKGTDHNVSVEITMQVPHALIRAEVNGKTVREAADICEEKLRKQIEKYKGKLHRRAGESGKLMPASTLEQIADTQEEFSQEQAEKIFKRKTFHDLKQMHEEEAIEQMDLLGHDFFVFENVGTGFISIVYKREDGTNGIIDIKKSAPSNN